MLFKQTLRFLPAQLLPALCQFIQLILWSHLVPPAVIGVVTLFTSIQEFLNLAFISFWTRYTSRYSLKQGETPEGLTQLRYASTAVVLISLTIQIAIALAIFFFTIDRHMSLAMMLALAGLVGGRSINLFQAERARAQSDAFGYSVAVMSGPVIGFLLGLGLLWRFGGSSLLIFAGFAVAQVFGVLFGIARDRSWIGFGRPDLSLIRHALAYGSPLIAGSVLAWVSQNASRIAVTYFFGLAAGGVYSLGMGLGYRAAMVAAMMVSAAAFPIAVRLHNAGDVAGARRQLANNGSLQFGVMAALMAGRALLSNDVLRLLVSRTVNGPVEPVMLWCLLAGSFICIREYFLNQFFLLAGVTRSIAFVSLGEAIVAVLLAVLIVPTGGATGGAIALAATSAVSLMAAFLFAKPVGRQVDWQALAKIGLATLVMAAAVLLTPSAQDMIQLLIRVTVGGVAYVGTLALCFRDHIRLQIQRLRRS